MARFNAFTLYLVRRTVRALAFQRRLSRSPLRPAKWLTVVMRTLTLGEQA